MTSVVEEIAAFSDTNDSVCVFFLFEGDSSSSV